MASLSPAPLPRSFYAQSVRRVARRLLGMRLVGRVGGRTTAGWVVETEAYLAARDSACHAAKGLTPRNAVMFGPPGYAYVYSIHAKWCFNVVTQDAGEGCAVLVRAVEPCQGIGVMKQRRASRRDADLCRGPARLCQALGIDKRCNGLDLTTGDAIWFEAPAIRPWPARPIAITRRIGVTSAKNLRLRYVVRDHPCASGPRHLSR